jgi:hypothetical protein
MTKVLAATANSSRPRVVRRAQAAFPEGFAWVYLGPDTELHAAWQEDLSTNAFELEYGEQLQALALESKEAFVEWLSGYGRAHASLEWWTSRIAERNTLVPSLFQDVCYLQLANLMLASSDKPLLVICERVSVLKTLHQNVVGFPRVRFGKSVADSLEWILRFGYVWTRFFLQSLVSCIAAKLIRVSRRAKAHDKGAPQILLHTCISDVYFGDDGVPRDRYLGRLPGMLKEMGFETITVPWLFQIKRSYWSALRWFAASGERYLVPEEYYTPRDYWWAVNVVVRQGRLPSSSRSFRGVDIWPLVMEARRKQLVDTGGIRFIMYYRLLGRLRQRGVRINAYVDLFENMASEKAALLGLKRWYPNARSIGFQHLIVVPPLFLSLQLGKADPELQPLPDVIVTNSPMTRDQLIDAGFPASILRVGPSLRFEYLMGETMLRAPEARTVLVAMAYDYAATRELMAKLLGAFPEDEGISFCLKPHPLMGEEGLMRAVGRPQLPPHMRCVDGSMEPWLRTATCAISGATTAAFEIAAAGVPLILVGRDTDVDINPLASFDDIEGPAYRLSDLRSRLIALVAEDGCAEARSVEWAQRMRAVALSPVGHETARAFVDGVDDERIREDA